eukprot:jgi/Mesen1/5664/ME000287S04923
MDKVRRGALEAQAQAEARAEVRAGARAEGERNGKEELESEGGGEARGEETREDESEQDAGFDDGFKLAYKLREAGTVPVEQTPAWARALKQTLGMLVLGSAVVGSLAVAAVRLRMTPGTSLAAPMGSCRGATSSVTLATVNCTPCPLPPPPSPSPSISPSPASYSLSPSLSIITAEWQPQQQQQQQEEEEEEQPLPSSRGSLLLASVTPSRSPPSSPLHPSKSSTTAESRALAYVGGPTGFSASPAQSRSRRGGRQLAGSAAAGSREDSWTGTGAAAFVSWPVKSPPPPPAGAPAPPAAASSAGEGREAPAGAPAELLPLGAVAELGPLKKASEKLGVWGFKGLGFKGWGSKGRKGKQGLREGEAGGEGQRKGTVGSRQQAKAQEGREARGGGEGEEGGEMTEEERKELEEWLAKPYLCSVPLRVHALRGSVPPLWIKEFVMSQGRRAKLSLESAATSHGIVEDLKDSLKKRQVDKRSAMSADVVSLGDRWLKESIASGLICPIGGAEDADWFKRLDPAWQRLVRRDERGNINPRGKIYAAPYRWGCTVIAFNHHVFADRGLAPIKDWDDLWRPEFAGRIAMVDSPREVVGAVLKSLGVSYNATSLEKGVPGGREAVADRFEALQKQIRVYDNEQYLTALKSGDAWVAVGWSSDILPYARRSSNTAVVVPAGGTALWADLWAIPATTKFASSASKVGGRVRGPSPLVSQWIDFCLQPARAAAFQQDVYVGSSPLALLLSQSRLVDPALAPAGTSTAGVPEAGSPATGVPTTGDMPTAGVMTAGKAGDGTAGALPESPDVAAAARALGCRDGEDSTGGGVDLAEKLAEGASAHGRDEVGAEADAGERVEERTDARVEESAEERAKSKEEGKQEQELGGSGEERGWWRWEAGKGRASAVDRLTAFSLNRGLLSDKVVANSEFLETLGELALNNYRWLLAPKKRSPSPPPAAAAPAGAARAARAAGAGASPARAAGGARRAAAARAAAAKPVPAAAVTAPASPAASSP